MMELGENRQWLGAQFSLKYFLVKFLKRKWLSHYTDWLPHVLSSPRSDHQAHRGSGKSEFWSLAVPLWDVIRGPLAGIDPHDIIVSYSEDQVRRLIRNIRVEVESNEFLLPLRPSTSQVWGTDQLGFANGYLISGLGFGTSSRGPHPRRIIVDDPLKDQGGMSREDQERAYFGVISGMAMEKTQIHAIGTPVEHGDLFDLLKANPVYQHTHHPAYRLDASVQCPELFTPGLIEMKRREMGSIHFAREMMLERIDPTTQPFKREYETLYDVAPERPRFMRVVTICDPAYTEGDGDYTALLTVGLTHGNHAYVLAAKAIRREDPGIIVDELFQAIAAYSPDAVGIKRRKGDAISFSFNERRTRENRWDFKYVEISDTKSKNDEHTRIGGMIPRWEARTIHIHKHMTDFLREIYEYRLDDSHAHDDRLDALADAFHPDLSQPNFGKRHVPSKATQVGKPLYRVGKDSTFAAQSDAFAPLWQRLDRRIYDAA